MVPVRLAAAAGGDLAAIAAAALLLGRPATAAGARGLHRFARERTGPAPRV